MFEELLPVLLRVGISIKDYWNLTFGEMRLYIENFNKVREEKQQEDMYISYQSALLTAAFVGSSMSGKQIPSFYEVFPEFNKSAKEDEKKQTDMYKDMFTLYAEQHNAKRRKEGK